MITVEIYKHDQATTIEQRDEKGTTSTNFNWKLVVNDFRKSKNKDLSIRPV